jgi:uncharacterized protein (DUF1697 family)
MNTYISILRGINVGGNRIIKMETLNVRTYIQSGNVVFQERTTEPKDLELRIFRTIKESYSFDVPIIIKTKVELEILFKNNPFRLKYEKEIDKLHITLFSDQPKQFDIENFNLSSGNDEYLFGDCVAYLYCPDGYGKTKLSNQNLEQKLKVSATTRNWKTLTELLNIANESIYNENPEQ